MGSPNSCVKQAAEVPQGAYHEALDPRRWVSPTWIGQLRVLLAHGFVLNCQGSVLPSSRHAVGLLELLGQASRNVWFAPSATASGSMWYGVTSPTRDQARRITYSLPQARLVKTVHAHYPLARGRGLDRRLRQDRKACSHTPQLSDLRQRLVDGASTNPQ